MIEQLPLLPTGAIFVASLVVLLYSAERFVGAAEQVGLAFGIPPFIIGMSVLAIGTSFPELITALFAVHNHHSEFVVGTVLGSNIANILLILGVTTMVSRSFTITWDLLHGDLPLLFGSVLLLVFVIYPISGVDLAHFHAVEAQIAAGVDVPQGARSGVTVFEALVLVGGYVLYLYYYAQRNREIVEPIGEDDARPTFRLVYAFWMLVGLAGVLVGANYTVESATRLAELLQIGAEVVAASAVAFGTSMPELVVGVSAARRGNFEMALGNITGSNIFNTFMVLGIPGLLAPFMGNGQPLRAGEESVLFLQMPFYGATIVLFLVIVLDKTLTRTEGLVILLAYALFITKLFGWI